MSSVYSITKFLCRCTGTHWPKEDEGHQSPPKPIATEEESHKEESKKDKAREKKEDEGKEGDDSASFFFK